MEKSVKRKNTTYTVEITEAEIKAKEYVNTMPGYGIGYSTSYILRLNEKSRKWAKARIWAINNSDSWEIASGHLPKSDFREYLANIKAKFETLEDDDPDLIELFNEIQDKVEVATGI